MPEEVQEEVALTSESEREFSGSTGEVYCQLLGVNELPKTPKDMPDSLWLPPGFLGDLEEAILATTEDGRERSQRIKWNRKEHKPEPGKTFLGSSKKAKKNGGFLGSMLQKYFGSKPLIHFHTHPWEAEAAPSEEDIITAKIAPRLAHMFLIGHPGEIYALCQTKKSAKLPISAFVPLIRVPRRLRKGDLFHHQLKMIEEMGFAVYSWWPVTGEISKGDLKREIKLRRHYPSAPPYEVVEPEGPGSRRKPALGKD
jgi:hypothetical protein